MTFFRTEMLFLAWIVPVLVLVVGYGMRRRQAILRLFAAASSLAVIAPKKSGARRWIKAALLMAALLFTAVSLAGPQYGYRWQEINQRGVDIIITLDCSRSMTAADIQPNRLERAKREVFDLLSMLQGDRVGLVAFAGTAFLQCPLTLDYDAFHLFLATLSPDYLPVGGTDITAALRTAVGGFDPESTAEKAILLITDGENTGSGDPVKAAQSLKEKEIKLFCIGIGGGEGVPIPEANGGFKKDRSGQIVLSRLDETSLKKMAVITGGTYVRSVAGDMDLDAIYTDEIRRTMDAQTLTSGRKQVWEDRFQWPLALALVCLIAELLLPVARKTIAASIVVAFILVPCGHAQANDTRDGIAAYEKGAFDAALTHFTEAQLADPESPERLYNVAAAYYKTGNFDAAADHYRQVLKTDDEQLKQNALYNLGNAEFRRGKAKEAIGHYEAALSMDPDNRLAKENLEFVKNVLEQQQQHSQKGQPDPNPDQQDEADSSAKRPSQASSSTGQQASQSDDNPAGDRQPKRPEFGNEMDERQAKQEQRQRPAETDRREESPAAQATPAEESQGDPGQAERMLNRLQDQPGRALMPAGKRNVEKDW